MVPTSYPTRSQAPNVADFLLAGAALERVALLTPKAEHTYGEVQSAALKVTHLLAAAGAEPGDRVMLLGDNSLFWVAAYLGILKAGLVCVPLPVNTSAADCERLREATGSRLAFTESKIIARNKDLFAGIRVITEADLQAAPESQNPWSVQSDFQPDQLAALMFTSGSTGEPRGVMVSHRNVAANTESIVEYLALTAEDRTMAVLPFHYCFGTSLLHTHLRSGGSLVLDTRFRYPETILQRLLDTECTGFAGVPSHYQILLRNSSLPRKQFPKLRFVQQAGGFLAPTFLRELREALPNTSIFVMYGQTEATSRLSYLPPEQLTSKPSSIGKGIPGVTLQVINEAGQCVSPGESGQIVAAGESITQGYWGHPAESANFFRDGKLFTGDVATVDEDGFIFITGRQKDFVKSGGRRVSCRQVEEQLLAFDELVEVAVIGVPDPILGEAVKAFVVPRTRGVVGLEERLRDFCRVQLDPHLVPKEIAVVDGLPKNSAGKVMKEALKTPDGDTRGR